MNTRDIKSEALKTRKVEDRWEEDSKKGDYLSYMNLREAPSVDKIKEQNDKRCEIKQSIDA